MPDENKETFTTVARGMGMEGVRVCKAADHSGKGRPEVTLSVNNENHEHATIQLNREQAADLIAALAKIEWN